MNSMTGFGRGEALDPETGKGFKTEIATVNRKQLELKFSLPRGMAEYETGLRAQVAEKLSRGTINVRVEYVSGTDIGGNNVDLSGVLSIWKAVSAFQAQYDIPGQVTISDLLKVPDAVKFTDSDFSAPEYSVLLKTSTAEALKNLCAMRKTEGERLGKDLLNRISIMEQIVGEIEPLAAELPKIQRERLAEHLKELLAEHFSDNDERILKEAVIWGDKLDVTEEITRLHCHFAHFRELAKEENCGRSLDFLVQEIFRECNTLGNKAASTEISPRIVLLKTELEKIREQVQNIE